MLVDASLIAPSNETYLTYPYVHKTHPIFQRLKRPCPSALPLNLPSPYPPTNGLQFLRSKHEANADEDNRNNGFKGDVEGEGC